MAQYEPYVDTRNHAAQYKRDGISICETILCIINSHLYIENHTAYHDPYVNT